NLALLTRPLAAAAVLLAAGSAQTARAADLVISTPTAFKALPGVVNGVLTVDNLTIAPGGSISSNDPISPGSSDAGDIKIVVKTAVSMYPGTAITAENRHGNGSGGNISILVGSGGNDGSAFNLGAGAVISSRKVAGDGSTGHSGDITIDASVISCD